MRAYATQRTPDRSNRGEGLLERATHRRRSSFGSARCVIDHGAEASEQFARWAIASATLEPVVDDLALRGVLIRVQQVHALTHDPAGDPVHKVDRAVIVDVLDDAHVGEPIVGVLDRSVAIPGAVKEDQIAHLRKDASVQATVITPRTCG